MYFFLSCRRCVLHQKVDPNLLLGELPGVSIVKPLMGIDPLLEGNLESHFLLNYPKVSILSNKNRETGLGRKGLFWGGGGVILGKKIEMIFVINE